MEDREPEQHREHGPRHDRLDHVEPLPLQIVAVGDQRHGERVQKERRQRESEPRRDHKTTGLCQRVVIRYSVRSEGAIVARSSIVNSGANARSNASAEYCSNMPGREAVIVCTIGSDRGMNSMITWRAIRAK